MKRIALTALQVFITIAIVWWVFHDPVKRAEIVATLSRANTKWFFAGIACYGFVELISAIRWQILLKVQGFNLSFSRVWGLTMIGVFFNFIIPGGTGGDAVKMFYLLKETPGRGSTALLSVVVDRLIGILALVVFAGILIWLKWDWLRSAPETLHWVYLALGIFAAIIGLLGVSFLITGLGIVHRLPVRFPGRDKLAEVAMAYNVYGKAIGPCIVAFIISFGTHIGYFGVFYCSILALGSSGMQIPTLPQFYSVMPIIDTLTALPISVGGVGWREKLFEDFLCGLCSASPGVAVAIASAGYVLVLLWGLLGALIYLGYRPSEHAALSAMRAKISEAEHELAEEEVAIESAAAGRPEPAIADQSR